MQINLNIFVNDNFTDSSLTIILDIFRTANILCERQGKALRFEISIVALSQKMVTSKFGLKLQPDKTIEELSNCDVLFLPGTWVESAAEIEDLLTKPDERKIISKMKQVEWGNTIVAASCSGVVFLAECGLLNSKPAIISWWLASYVKKRWPRVDFSSQNMVLQSGNIITAGAAFSQIDLSLHILGHFGGTRLVKECSNILLLRERPSQTDEINLKYLSANDNVISKAERWVSQNISRQFEMAELTTHLGIGSRTFARRLQDCLSLTPIQFVQRMRVEKALALLQVSNISLEEISHLVGYNNPASLAKLIKKQTGKTASSLR